MKSNGICYLALLLGFQPAEANARQSTDISQTMALLGQKAKEASQAEWKQSKSQSSQAAIIGRKTSIARNDYESALIYYNNKKSKVSMRDDNSLYPYYQILAATYTSLITMYYPSTLNDHDPHLPVVEITEKPVSTEIIKENYLTLAHDYLEVLKDFSGTSHYLFPTDPPPFPPVATTDKDYSKLAGLEKTMKAAREETIKKTYDKKSQAQAKLRELGPFGPDVPLGGLHTRPGQSSGQQQCYRPIGSGPDGIIMGMGPCD